MTTDRPTSPPEPHVTCACTKSPRIGLHSPSVEKGPSAPRKYDLPSNVFGEQLAVPYQSQACGRRAQSDAANAKPDASDSRRTAPAAPRLTETSKTPVP